MSLKTVNIPTANLSDLEDALNAELVGGFEVVQVHDNLIVLESGGSLGHSSYQVVPLPASMDTDEVDVALNAPVDASPSASLLTVHPNFVIFVI